MAPGAAFAAPAARQAAGCLPQWQAGWVRLPPNAAMPMAAGFGRLHNPCGQALAVVAVRSPAFAEVSLHQTTQVDGVSKMRELERLPLAAGADAVLKPGGLHLMLMQPAQPLREGASVPISFVLEDGREVRGALKVSAGKP
ncbi:copper chaperone PCu(A)C [Xanthomonas graminis]|uniref:copper chaperone PCu(A)C n=1 Tax=Xanthomonas graminis TaxID=3390026 RepID=UPI00147D2266|nr:copper chaperone PCu(A)C [Xanthomonas translucens pv. graminis]WIH10655.1 copper chaperone PCu(A)C [Xanthomonas translucens pv. graminis]WIH14130.1 copper chaperone PCu(A)C [Xanthomonas translucens pv. graminis]WIH17805.1 copper chaperone PCu(A)C [Xanthomonas translucens pv. graminis]